MVIDDLVEDLVDIGFFVTVLTPDDGATPFNGESYCVEPVLRSSGYLWGLLGPCDPGERLEDVAIIDEYAFSADMVIFSDRPIPHPYPCPTALWSRLWLIGRRFHLSCIDITTRSGRHRTMRPGYAGTC